VPLLTVRLDGAWQRAQRRSDVRLGVAIKPRLAARLDGETRQPLRVGIVNISAGGVQLRSQDAVSAGERIELAFELMGIAGELRLTARVQRVERQDRGSLPVWEAGCVFEALADRTAQRIVQFIFAQQCALARARRRSA
jgi:c-di-GMP-binding flagellar brake protein YcgR